MKKSPISLHSQRGVAVITALLLTTLAITIVASLFWQQQVQVRSIENQRLQSQKEWILRGALDWARLILRRDAIDSPQTQLGAAWATPLQQTKLDEFVENGRTDTEASEASLQGYIIDAQSLLNLTNLTSNGMINAREVAAFAKLLSLLSLDPQLANASAMLQVQAQRRSVEPNAVDSSPRMMGLTRVDDLLAVPGMNPAMLAKLREFVIVLPRATPLNINTASAQVLAAKVAGLSLSDAMAAVAARKQAFFLSVGDLQHRFPSQLQGVQGSDLSVASNFFLVNGDVRMGRAALQVQSLVERSGTGATVLWTHEN
jgi:general secretion pathway protein K